MTLLTFSVERFFSEESMEDDADEDNPNYPTVISFYIDLAAT